MSVQSFRKKPVVIEAIQWSGANFREIADWAADSWIRAIKDDLLVIPTLEGDHIADIGDWIIRGVQGEFYPCKPDIFEQTMSKPPRIPARTRRNERSARIPGD